MSMQAILDNAGVKLNEDEDSIVGNILRYRNCYTLGSLFMQYGRDILGKDKSWRFKAIYDRLASSTPIDEIEADEFDALIGEMVDVICNTFDVIIVNNGWLIDDVGGTVDFYPDNFGNTPWIVHVADIDNDHMFDHETKRGIKQRNACVLDFPKSEQGESPVIFDYYLI